MRLGSHFFKLEDHVVVVRRNKDLERGNYRKAADENNFMLRGFNHLLIFKKSRKSSPALARPDATSDANHSSSKPSSTRSRKKPTQRSTSRTERNDRRRTKKAQQNKKLK